MSEKYIEEMIETRRALHKRPELGWTEFETMWHICSHLEQWGIPYVLGTKVINPAFVMGRNETEVKDAMEGMLSPDVKEEISGTAEVLQTYKISKVGTIAGCMVREGKIKRSSKVRLIRDGIVIYTGELGSLKRFKDDVKEVASGYDCGLNIANYNDVKEGDIVEAYEEVEVSKSL